MIQQQQTISDNKLLFKSPQFTKISSELENQQYDKNLSLLQQYDQSNISCFQNQNYQEPLQIGDNKSYFITNQPSKVLEQSSSMIQVRNGRKTIDRQKRDDTIPEYQTAKTKKSKRKDLSNRDSQIEEKELIYQQDEIIMNQQGINNEKIWVSKFYKILTFVNRFAFRSKQRLVFFHPNQLQNHQAQAINDLVKLIVLLIEVVLLCHLFACIWYSIGNYEVNNGTGANWISKFSADNNIQYQQYIDSIYFSVVTIGTIGYGDIVPVTTLEKGCLTAMAIFSCGIFAYILSNIQNVYREYQMKQEGYLNKLIKLNNYMFNREVNPNLQQMARKYLEYVHQQGFQQGVMPCDTLNSLSSSLRQEIKEDIFKKSINNIKFLQQYSNQLKIQLSRKMSEVNYGPDEFIMKKGQQQQPRLYFILKGQVEVCLDKGLKNGYQETSTQHLFSLQKQNDVLGLFEFTSQSQICMTNARSIGVTTVHVLELDDFLESINLNTSDKEIYYQQKDKINIYHNYGQAKLFCYSCKSSQHLIKNCPIFFYKPNQERVVNIYIKEQNNIKKSIRKKSNQRFNSLAIANQLKQDVQDFCDQNESQINSLYQSQSTFNECSIQNLDVNEGLLHQQSNLSPLKPKSGINLRLIKYRKSQEDDSFNEQNDTQKMQLELKDKMKQIDFIQQEIQQYDNFKTPEDSNASSQANQKQFNYLKSMPEKNNQEIQLLNNLESKQRRSVNISVVVPKRHSVLANNKICSNISNENFQTHSPQQTLGQIFQKELNDHQKMHKDNSHEHNKVLKSQTSFQNQYKHVKNKNNISFTEIQKALNLLTTTIGKKDNQTMQDDIQEELITDTIKSYQFYMIHNNAAVVINNLNLLINKKQEIQRQKILDVFSTSVQYRSICQKI